MDIEYGSRLHEVDVIVATGVEACRLDGTFAYDSLQQLQSALEPSSSCALVVPREAGGRGVTVGWADGP